MIEDEKWYAVKELSLDSGWAVDSIRRRIYSGHLKAVMLPRLGGSRKRVFRSCRVQGREWRRFLEQNQFCV
jgi:hypothetical protein